MNRQLGLSLLVIGLVATLLVGCRDGAELSELDKFIARTEALEGKALDDTLRALTREEAPFSVYANYLIGNGFYEEAGVAAQTSGWGEPAATGLLDSAEVYFTRCVELDSTFIEAMVNLGSLWDDRAQALNGRTQRDANLNKAKEFYEMALAVDPTDEKARCNLGSLYLGQRKTEEALGHFQQCLVDNPNSALAHYNLAIIFAEAKIYREAITEWEMAVKIDPDGDVGARSRENIRIVNDLLHAPAPDAVK